MCVFCVFGGCVCDELLELPESVVYILICPLSCKLYLWLCALCVVMGDVACVLLWCDAHWAFFHLFGDGLFLCILVVDLFVCLLA